MSSRYWIKLYHEILDDPKMGRLTDALFRRAIELFLIAGDYDREGLLPPPEDIAWRLRVPEETLSAQMDALREVGILTRADGGQWTVTHFKDRQAAEPPSRRMRRYRETLQKHDIRYEDVTKRNTDVDRDKETDAEEMGDAERSTLRDIGLLPNRFGCPRAASPSSASENAGGGCDPADELVKTFIDHTRIPLNTGGEGKWADALRRLKDAGVDKLDVVTALGECAHKGIVIANLGSIVNPAIISMARRKGKANKEEDYTRYLKGEYAEFLRN